MMAKIPNPIDQHVGARVRMRRILAGLSQEKLGEALDLTFQQIQKYEKGTNRIGASRLQQISKILQVPPSFFFEGAPAGDVTPQHGFADSGEIVEFLSTVEGLQLNKSFATIKDPKVRRKIVELIAAVADAVPSGVAKKRSK
jgi:transcriptional regulator with XRE-family HTH domain